MDNLFEEIEAACYQAHGAGIQLIRGAIFDWTGAKHQNPIACSAMGALLWQRNLAVQNEFNFGQKIWSITGKDRSWNYRFHQGFNNGTVLSVQKFANTEIYKPEEISLKAFDLAKLLLKKKLLT